jgi:hypothetical protein
MREQAGYTLVELVVAAAVMLTVTSGIFAVIGNGLGSSAVWNESSDLHQRARVAAETFSAEINASGAGALSGPLIRFLPAVEPRRRGFGAASDAITVRYVPLNGPSSTLSSDLSPGVSSAAIVLYPGCGAGTTACGFVAGADVILFDQAGNWDVSTVQSIGPGTLELANTTGVRSSTYPAGSRIAQVVETTLFLDRVERQLRREQPGGSALPVLDNVVDLQLSYLGDPLPPAEPIPPLGMANCLATETGASIPQPVLYADRGGLAVLPIAMLTDGPYCGTGGGAYDVDLLRIRTVRAVLRLQAGVETLRGTDPRMFARPGSATTRERMIPDEIVSFDLSPRNLQR